LDVQAAKQFVATVNGNLQSRVPLEALLLGVRLTYVDVNAIFAQIIQRPAAFGFSNSTGAAFNSSTGIVQPNPNSYVFWDGFHPTTPAHQIAAQTVWARVNAPSTFLRLHGVLKRGSSRFGLDRIRLSSYHSLRGSLPGRF
jgi:Phospholipase/lecithinase/hemolysin